MAYPGQHDVDRAVSDLAAWLPPALAPLARLAYDYRWSWTPRGPELFAHVDPELWRRFGENPVLTLRIAPREHLEELSRDEQFRGRVADLAAAMDANAPGTPSPAGADEAHPIAFLCSEFAVHPSLPIYSGGLGVLAGDILKQAADQSVPLVGVGLLYRSGYFHQQLGTSGWQHEYWNDTHPELLPAVVVTDSAGSPLDVCVHLDGEDVHARVWRVDVGRVPLYLLDTDVPENEPVGRWVTSRLYEGNRSIRLAQYGMLGVGGVRALRAMGVEPSVFHLNEGHPALAAFELLRESLAAGESRDDAWRAVRERLVFTTHTPVAAGNETYGRDEILSILAGVAEGTGDREEFLAVGRIHPDRADEPSGMTALAIRASSSVNGVSRRHGSVARSMWRPLFDDRPDDEVPITSVTNGVHLPTWIAPVMRDLLDRHLGPSWITRADDPATWDAVAEITDAELWAARNTARAQLIAMARTRTTSDRLRRGEGLGYADAADRTLEPDMLTIGFARRLATYKRLHLLLIEPERALRLLGGDRPLQFVVAGRAHPQDDDAKRIVQRMFDLKGREGVAGRVAYLEDYDLSLARTVVAGCDVWVNMPRPPLEASGTSGMKAGVNGVLNLSVLDGWWVEGYDGTNGWAIDGEVDDDAEGQDRRHAGLLLDILEQQIVPLFHTRDESGIPVGWLDMVRSSLRSIGPGFGAGRMVGDYLTSIYPPERRLLRADRLIRSGTV